MVDRSMGVLNVWVGDLDCVPPRLETKQLFALLTGLCNFVYMTKAIFNLFVKVSLSLSILLLLSSCHSDITLPNDAYEGIFLKAGTSCPSFIKITSAPKNGMEVGTRFNVYDKDEFADGTKVWFKVKSYELDTEIHTYNCVWGKYAAVLDEIHKK